MQLVIRSARLESVLFLVPINVVVILLGGAVDVAASGVRP
jgi:hypothetical protein